MIELPLQPRVSVLMTLYNPNINRLRSSLESILSQNYQNFELIIVDDGSENDVSGWVKRKFYQNLDKVILIECGRIGRSKALNKGLSFCSGKYIAINDADDLSFETRLSDQVKFLEQNEDYVLVGAKMTLFNYDRMQKIEYKDPRPTNWEDVKIRFSRGQPFQHSAVMMRTKDVIAVKGYNEKIKFLLDRDIFLRLADRGKMVNLDNVLIQLGLSENQFFKSTYKGRIRHWMDFKYRLKATLKFSLGFKTLMLVLFYCFSGFTPENLKSLIRKENN